MSQILSIASLRPGTAITLDGTPYIITWSQFHKVAQGKGTMKTTLKNLVTGSTIQRTFSGNDRIAGADLSFKKAQYLYEEQDGYAFMDLQTYDQFTIPKDLVCDNAKFLVENAEISIRYFEEKPIGVELPPKLDFKVTGTDPGVRGDSAQGGTKPATLETGAVIQVPLFVNIGDVVRVNTDTGQYVERVKK